MWLRVVILGNLGEPGRADRLQHRSRWCHGDLSRGERTSPRPEAGQRLPRTDSILPVRPRAAVVRLRDDDRPRVPDPRCSGCCCDLVVNRRDCLRGGRGIAAAVGESAPAGMGTLARAGSAAGPGRWAMSAGVVGVIEIGVIGLGVAVAAGMAAGAACSAVLGGSANLIGRQLERNRGGPCGAGRAAAELGHRGRRRERPKRQDRFTPGRRRPAGRSASRRTRAGSPAASGAGARQSGPG